MMKKVINIVRIFVIVLMLANILNTKTFASKPSTYESNEYNSEPIAIVADSGLSEIKEAGREFIRTGEANQGKYTADFFAGEFLSIGSILVGIGTIIIIGVTIIMGIKWATAKPDKKAQLQQQLIGLVVSIVVIFGAVGIWNLVIKIANSSNLSSM